MGREFLRRLAHSSVRRRRRCGVVGGRKRPAPLLGAPPGNRSEAAAPRDPARFAVRHFVCRQEVPTSAGAGTDFHKPNAMRAGRPDAARQSPRGVRRAVLSAHQQDSRRGVNLRRLPRPSERRGRIRPTRLPLGLRSSSLSDRSGARRSPPRGARRAQTPSRASGPAHAPRL